MGTRAARLAAVAATIWTAAAGCRRTPLADGRDAAPDHPIDAPTMDGGPAEVQDAPFDTARDSVADLIAGDTAPPDASPAPRDADTTADAVDAPRDTTDAPPDSPADRVPVDRIDGPDARWEDQPCGPLGFYCAPFACDVARGICKTVCASDDDCVGGHPCRRGTCGGNDRTPCNLNDECNSGFCAQGACCSTACNQICFSCALPGTIGVCTAVANGGLDPQNQCAAGYVCDGSGRCANPPCAIDADCGPLRWCVNNRCAPCVGLCVSNADCTIGAVCVMRNSCSYCAPRDAGAE